jgi:hypothetical protein
LLHVILHRRGAERGRASTLTSDALAEATTSLAASGR